MGTKLVVEPKVRWILALIVVMVSTLPVLAVRHGRSEQYTHRHDGRRAAGRHRRAKHAG